MTVRGSSTVGGGNAEDMAILFADGFPGAERKDVASKIQLANSDVFDGGGALRLTIDQISPSPTRTVTIGSMRRRPRAITSAPGGPPDDLPT